MWKIKSQARLKIIRLVMVVLLIAAGITMRYFRSTEQQPELKKLVAKFTFGKKGEGLGEFSTIGALVINGEHLYVSDLDNHRIQVLEIKPDGSLTAKFTFGKQGRGLGEFDGIGDLVIKGDCLYVADPNNHRIQVLKINPDGSLSAHFTFGKKGKELGNFAVLGEFMIVDDLVIRRDYLYVVEGEIHYPSFQVLKINPDGSLFAQSTFGKQGRGVGEFYASIGDLVIKGDYLYVADPNNHRIQVLKINPDGNLSAQSIFGKKGTGLGEFDGIGDLVIKGDYLYVAIHEFGSRGGFFPPIINERIQIIKINPDGNLSAQSIFGRQGKELGNFDGITDLLIKGDYLYVAEAVSDLDIDMKKGNHRIQVFKINSDGNISPRFTLGKKGKRSGEFNAPSSPAVKDNYLFVVDSGNHRIQVLEIKY